MPLLSHDYRCYLLYNYWMFYILRMLHQEANFKETQTKCLSGYQCGLECHVINRNVFLFIPLA